MSGRRIDDHNSWIGKAPRGQVFPERSKMKDESSAEGAGEVMRYEDTTEAIRDQQEEGVRKAERHKMRPGYRN